MPIWITEFGWATAGQSTAYTTDEAGQATRIGDFVRLVVANQHALNLRGLVLYQWRDDAQGGTGFGPYTGLLRTDGSAKPGLAAYRDAIAGAPPGRCPPVVPGHRA